MRKLVLVFGLMSLLFIFAWAAETPGFDHYETSFPLDFTHALVSCENCHIQGVFVGTPSRCVECHARGSRIQASSASLQHIRTTNDCEFCHQSGAWQSVKTHPVGATKFRPDRIDRGRYRWRVRAVAGDSKSAWSEFWRLYMYERFARTRR